jgi:hypothetical protein
MKFKTNFFYLTIALSSLLWMGCGKEGPQGPEGNANVLTSQWYSPASWSGESGDWYFDVDNSEITADVVESGVILAYMSVPGDVYNDYTVRPLPAFAIGADWDFLLPNDGNSNYGRIEFTTDMTAVPTTDCYFRFIIIPASYDLKSSPLKSGKVNDLRKMSYQEVCKLLGIKE